jgi:hypothetical protein
MLTRRNLALLPVATAALAATAKMADAQTPAPPAPHDYTEPLGIALEG